MNAPIVIVALLLPAMIGSTRQIEPSLLACVGTGQSQSYPFGFRETSTTRYRVMVQGRRTSIFHQGLTDENICPEAASCTVTVAGDLVQVNARNVPNADPLLPTHFRLNRKKLVVEANGGSLDGGWSISGRGTRQRPNRWMSNCRR